MKFKPVKLATAMAGILCLTLAGCGGGSSSSIDTATPVASLSGVAAVGAALAGATVTLKDAAGATLTTISDAGGAYSFADVSGMTAPFMIQAVGSAGGIDYTLYSALETAPAAGVSGVVNVTPATHAVVAQATGGDPAVYFADTTKIQTLDDSTALKDAKAKLVEALADALTALGLDSTKVDLFTTAFSATGSGLDKLLDVIAFEANATGSITVTDKATASTVVVATSSPVTKLPAPTAENLAIDPSGIKNLLAAFNALSDTKENITSPSMAALFAKDFLLDGANKATQIALLGTEAVGMTMTGYVLDGCKVVIDVPSCKIELSLKSGSNTGAQSMSVVQDTSTKSWSFAGNDKPFDFEFKPVVWQSTNVQMSSIAAGNIRTAQTPTVKTGFNFNSDGQVPVLSGVNLEWVPTYKSVKAFYSIDDGTTWTFLEKFTKDDQCYGLSVDDGNSNNGNCGNFVATADAVADSLNDARSQGKAKIKIAAFTTADYTGTPEAFVFRPKSNLFNTSTGTSVATDVNYGIDVQTLATNTVNLVGKPDFLKFKVHQNKVTSLGFYSIEDKSEVAALNGKFSIQTAKDLCGVDCLTVFDTTNNYIPYVMTNGKDSYGRGIWKDYYTVVVTP
ncbi:MAG: hypothetical protein RLZZ591_9 [Pseudomonadota bacterium]|jgi:hypothetical protein